jgi:hypothetical protein
MELNLLRADVGPLIQFPEIGERQKSQVFLKLAG